MGCQTGGPPAVAKLQVPRGIARLTVTIVTPKRQRHDGTCSFATAGGPPVCLICCQTTSPMRHCKMDSYKHDF
ncbi:unnamed protein product [Staurois parvus]|uniref:Uncharacterized protein n=1 Tax=Staurois parvus TaxID=386267 RepID=A0ABN9DHP7_9NEOB|nr:unnamed protein product [Staurois parvus]